MYDAPSTLLLQRGLLQATRTHLWILLLPVLAMGRKYTMSKFNISNVAIIVNPSRLSRYLSRARESRR